MNISIAKSQQGVDKKDGILSSVPIYGILKVTIYIIWYYCTVYHPKISTPISTIINLNPPPARKNQKV